MLNILIPAMGENTFFKDYYFPKLMLEVDGESILEKVINNFSDLNNSRFTFIFKEDECIRFHIDDSARVITNGEGNIITLKNQTKGPLCTCLMAADYINNEEPLIIANADQVIDIDYNHMLDNYVENYCDVGILTFSNIHPRWDYIREEDGVVTEVAIKRPISRHAVAGVFYFQSGALFVEAAKRGILKNCFENIFSISMAVNELILMGKLVKAYEIEKEQFHSFYSPEKIMEYNKERQ